MVNIDGMPSPRRHLEIIGHERTRMLEEGMQHWLQHRRAIADLVRKAGSLEELAKRRGRMNPRLSQEWLQYLVTVGGRHDDDGWRWKIDPQLRFGGFGPWRHTWSLAAMHALSMPVLGILGTEMEEMGWGITADQLRPFLPSNVRLEEFKDVGHFIHIEKPRETADLVLEFLS
jgi:pimeloyl-ACP methyl ester carboxylesterase